MSKKHKSKSTSKYHKQSTPHGAWAFVELNRRRIYLGEYNSPKSRAEYHRVLTDWEVAGRRTRFEQADLSGP